MEAAQRDPARHVRVLVVETRRTCQVSTNRPLTGGVDFMYQDVAFLPVTRAASSRYACSPDATDAALSHRAPGEPTPAERELLERERMKDELRIAHRLESAAAGIAHDQHADQYVADSISFIGEAFGEMRCIVRPIVRPCTTAPQARSRQRRPGVLEQNVHAAVDRALRAGRVAT
jgi:hypothetical protein